MATVPS